MKIIKPDGTDAAVTLGSDGSLPVTVKSGGGSGGGDASAANQALQITAEQATRTSVASIDGKLTSGAQITALSGNAAQAAVGFTAKISPFGSLNVSPATVPLMTDAFDTTLDTTVRWTASGTVPPVNTNGNVVLSLGAVNSASSVLVSQPTFSPTLSPYVLAFQQNLGSAQTNPNAHRFFGMGLVSAYASATPLTNGHGFEVDLTGALNAVVYISGTRYVINSTNAALITPSGSWATNMVASTYGQAMVWPPTGTGTFVMQYVNGTVFFYYASANGVTFDVPIGVCNYVPAATTLPVRFASITTPAVSTVLATTFQGSSYVLGGSIGNVISDPIYGGMRSATVNADSSLNATLAASATGGSSVYSAPGGTGNALLTSTPVAIKTSAGCVYGFDFYNAGAAAAFVQFFDLATGSVTLGTTVPKFSKWIPQGGSWEEKFPGDARIGFATAITFAATTTPTGSTAPATGIAANVEYK